MKELRLIINNILQQKKMWNRYRQLLIIEKWNELVGREIGAVTRPKQVKKGVIHVAVKDSTWSYHLTLLKPQLLEKINRFAGEVIIKDIFFLIDALHLTRNMDLNEDRVKFQPATDQSRFINEIRKLKRQISKTN